MAADWKKIKAEYIQGTSYRKLVKKYGVSSSTLLGKIKAEKWTDLRKQKQCKTNAKIVERIASQEAEKAVDLDDTLRDLAMRLAKNISDGINDGTYVKASDVRDVTIAMKNLREIAGARARKDLEEQQARIDKLRKEAREEEQNNEIRVVIADDLKAYSQ